MPGNKGLIQPAEQKISSEQKAITPLARSPCSPRVTYWRQILNRQLFSGFRACYQRKYSGHETHTSKTDRIPPRLSAETQNRRLGDDSRAGSGRRARHAVCRLMRNRCRGHTTSRDDFIATPFAPRTDGFEHTQPDLVGQRLGNAFDPLAIVDAV